MKSLIQLLKQILVVVFITLFITTQTLPVFAEEVPVIPQPPSSPAEPAQPQQSVQPQSASSPANPSTPQAPANPVSPAQPQAPPSADKIDTPLAPGTNQVKNGSVGDVTIHTADSTNTSTVSTSGNINSISSGSGGGGGGASVTNSRNGVSSSNSGSVASTNSNNLSQDNSARVESGASATALTGQNSASRNVGNSAITTGNANTSGTIVSALNTNTSGVSVSEFNVADNHTGDIVLDFMKNCVSGCGTASSSAASNTVNGDSSTNSATTVGNSQSTTTQTNVGDLGNSLVLAADSGNNKAGQNTGGDSTIKTGGANVAGNALTFLNNNLSGNVQFGVVNIFGTLRGDIILPITSGSPCVSCGLSSLTAVNAGNGAGSTNTVGVSNQTADTLAQTNAATIENNLKLSAATGNNLASSNTGGDSSIKTGKASTEANVLNIANSNIDGGNMWLVIVNRAGQWIGQILGAPDGATFAGSSGTKFAVNSNGEITATNSGNGVASTNNALASNSSNTSLAQQNIAHVVNNLDLSANTGSNNASRNTGGKSTIQTGDAKVIANLVNFVNNNIKGNGKLIVTVINVFGNWFGDFVSPGTTQRVKDTGSHADSVPINTATNLTQGDTSHRGGSSNPSSTSSTQTSQSVLAGVQKNTHVAFAGFTQSNNQNIESSVLVGSSQTQKTSSLLTKASKQINVGSKFISLNLAWLFLIPGIILLLTFIEKLLIVTRRIIVWGRKTISY